jgi:hypothetical protein
MDIKKIKTELQEELLQLESVKGVFWEYLDFFTIDTTHEVIFLGEGDDGQISWNSDDATATGETNATSAPEIAKAFGQWLEMLRNA